MEVNFTDLDPEVDTMVLGETEHNIKIDKKQFVLTVVVEDTQMPIFKGAEDVMTLTGKEIDVEKELKERITAEDVVDGELEITFEINKNSKNEHTYDVEAKATDKNDNETVENFEVIVEFEEVKEETVEEKISFKTVKQDDANLNKGTTKVSTEGENGTKKVTYEVTYINNEEKSREKVKEETNKEPTDKVVLVGTKTAPKTESKLDTGSSNNTSSNNTQEKPKQEKSKEENKPKPDNKPEPDNKFGKLKKPSSVPSGGTLKADNGSHHDYSYSKNLSGGGKLTDVSVADEYGKHVILTGTDKDDQLFVAKVTTNRNTTFFLYYAKY